MLCVQYRGHGEASMTNAKRGPPSFASGKPLVSLYVVYPDSPFFPPYPLLTQPNPPPGPSAGVGPAGPLPKAKANRRGLRRAANRGRGLRRPKGPLDPVKRGQKWVQGASLAESRGGAPGAPSFLPPFRLPRHSSSSCFMAMLLMCHWLFSFTRLAAYLAPCHLGGLSKPAP